MSNHFFGMDPDFVNQLLPLGDSIIGAAVTLLTAAITYGVGRSRNRAELDNLKAEKKSIEAASGVSTAEAAQVISEAAAATVQPLLDRIREQREELKYFNDRNSRQLDEIELLRTRLASVQSDNELLKRNYILRGEPIPTLPPEVK
jgi:gas vesicle protein